MIGAAVAGSWLGASVVSGWPRRNIQIGMGGALLVAAALFLLQILGVAPGGRRRRSRSPGPGWRSGSRSTSCSAR